MDDVHPKMRFSLTPPASKAIFSSSIKLGAKWNRESSGVSKCEYQNGNNINNNNESTNCPNISCDKDTMQREEDKNNSNKPTTVNTGDAESTSDYKQWLHAMKLVARLPGGIPPEFRRKLWLSLADKYLKAKNVDWTKEEEKCFCEKWREDDEELGIQIVKDLHRTGSTLCTGPAGDINQAKLKRILLGYARYNPQVGYCQGFNMLGALILQVMDKEEIESMKVMIYLVEGILPPGYFCGSMGGLQADMAVFRDLMQTKLPRLARHLQKLQGPIENAYEPPLTNVFTMQWFLTMFCTCLPMSCVLRVWDLVLIEGSDVLLRTALALWGLLEDRVLSTRSADDFYGKMGSFSSELLNGHLIDSNGLIEKVVQLGPIQDIQKLRDKHLNSMTPLKNKQGLNLYYDDDEADMDEDSRLAVATVWGLSWGRRGSQGQAANAIAKQATESKDRIALDISLLKKQYDRLRERQKQAHIILTTACSAARQSAGSTTYSTPLPVNQLLSGRPAIVTNKGRRTGPPSGAVPPARKPSLPAVLQDKPLEKHLRRGETIQWRDTSDTKRRRDSLTWKEIKAERAALSTSGSAEGIKSQKIRTKRLGKSDSSSYSEESGDEVIDKAGSSSDTSLCDDDNHGQGSNRNFPALRANTLKTSNLLTRQKSLVSDYANRQRPKSWAPSNSDIPFVLMTTDSPSNSADEGPGPTTNEYMPLPKEQDEDDEEGENSATESDQNLFAKDNDVAWSTSRYSPLKEDMPLSDLQALNKHTDLHTPPPTSLITTLRIDNTIESPPVTTTHLMESTNSLGSENGEECDEETNEFGVSDEGVTNQYFERVNSTERPTKLDLFYSLNEETSIRDAYKDVAKEDAEENHYKNNKNRCMDLLVDYSEKSSAACIAEAKTEISNTLQKSELTIKPELGNITSAASKRRNPRRLTLTRSSTMEIEKRYQALEKRLSIEASCKYKIPSTDKDNDLENVAAREEHKKASEISVYEPQVSDEIHELQDEEKATASTIVSLLQRKSKIPSTADLELRFANIVMDRVSKVSSMSDSEGSKTTQKTPTSPKEPIRRSPINTGPTKDADKGKTKAKDANVKNDVNSSKEDIDTEEDAYAEDVKKDHALKTVKSSNVTSPDNTTASKENSLKRKKEPPDNKTEDEPTEEKLPEEKNKSTNNSNVNKDKNAAKDLGSGKDQVSDSRKQPQSNAEHKKSQLEAESNEKTISDSEKSKATSQDDSQKVSAKKDIQKKSPPTTAELEKRFDALEKQMSISKNESDFEEDDRDASTEMQQSTEKKSESAYKSPEKAVKPSNESRNMANQVLNAMKSSASRRASEPPSTEDLEKRFEVLKRRMSSKAFEMNMSRRKASENLDDAEQDTQDTSEKENVRATLKESPPSTDSLEQRFDKLQRDAESAKSAKDEKPKSEEGQQSNVKETLRAKIHRATESSAASNDGLSSIVQMAVEARRAAESPSQEKNKLGDVAQRAAKARRDTQSPTTSKESFSGIMQKAVEAHKAAETPTPVKESFSDIMHMAVKAHKEAETSTPVKESFSDIMHMAVKAHKEAETPTPVKESFSDIMHMAVKAHKAAETPTPAKESFSDIMQKAVEAHRAAETSTPVKESFSDIMHMAVKAHKAVETPTASKDSLSGIVQLAVDSRKNTKTPIKEKDTFGDIAQKAVKTHKTTETPTANKDSLSDIVQMAVDGRKGTETPTKEKDNLADIAQRAVKTQKASITSKDSFGGIAEMAIEARKNQESSQSKAKQSLGDNVRAAVKSSRTAETPTKTKDNFSDIMQMAVKAQRNLSTPTKTKDSLSGIVQMAVEAQRTTMESPEEEMSEENTNETSEPINHLKDTDRPGSRSALIEELQSKMSASADGESIKPSSINPNRKIPQNTHILRKSNTDETSETHATTAYSKSGKNEQFHSPNRKMVRRFSDLPSRADLENRLLFLEEQLSKTLLQQRRASDSEVASHSRDNARPPGTLRFAGKLESRVRELEKQLSGTSKSAKPLDNLHIATSRIPLEITADSIDATSRELVRYTHYGEIDEPDIHNPINISINIHMTLNKDDLDGSGAQSMSRADEINKRLLILEQQLNTSKMNIASSASIPQELCESAKNTCSEHLPSETDETQTEKVVDAPDESQVEEGALCNESKDDPMTSDIPSEKDINTEVIQESSAPKTESMEVVVEPMEQNDEEPDTSFVREEQITAKERKRLEAIAKAEELDRRLQILEEHMKNSPPSTASEHMHREAIAASPKKDDVDVAQTPKVAKSIDTENTKEMQEKASDEPAKASQKNVASENVAATAAKEVTINKKDDKIESDVGRSDNTASADGARVIEATKASEDDRVNKTQNANVAGERSNDVPLETLDISQMVPVEVNKKTLVLVLDNEPKAVKVRRLTRANTEELEGLFQALEQQLIERGQIKHEDIAKAIEQEKIRAQIEEDKSAKEMSDLSKEIEEFSKSCGADKTPTKKKPKEEDDYDWGKNPVKHHLKKKTVHLPSTKELESRFRSLERQIKLFEDVEKIDVEQRLTEIDRKLKLQYSLSHETDLVRFLDLCEGKGLDDTPPPMEQYPPQDRTESHEHCCEHTRCKAAKRHQSPGRVQKMEAPLPSASNVTPEQCCEHMRCKAAKRHQSPGRVQEMEAPLPPAPSRSADLKKTKQKSTEKKREPIHPLEMLLDPSPEERDIPTTGELEHRMRILEENRDTPSPSSRKSQSKSPIKSQAYTDFDIPDSPSPTGRGLPTAEQLEARLAALEKQKKFDFKMQKDYKQFNQKLKDIISPSLSFEEFKAARSSSSETASRNLHRSPSPRAVGCAGSDASCPKVIRFHEDEHQRPKSRNDTDTMVSKPNDVLQILEENANMIQRLLKKPIADSHYSSSAPAHCSVHEGLGVMGIRLMRETSPLRRKGTHTGVPLRTGENINDQLTSIKNTIKSIDSLCEEKPYRKERCQQYIDSLFTDSTHFASKKSSLDDLTARHLSRSTSREYGPSIRISEHSPAFTRSIGSAESIRSSSPLRPTAPLQYHSNRDLRREISPRRRRDEEREENESRVRRDNLMPNIHNYNHSPLSHSLTKFHKVDSQLISNDVDVIDVERLSSNETKSIRVSNTNTSTTANTTITPHTNAVPTNDTTFRGSILDRPISPYRQLGLSRSNTPVYTPAKLEIRHTTVTSTFYDRVLAEKQLEKKHSTTANASKSPLLELPIRPCFQSDRSPTTLVSPDPTIHTLAGHDSATGNYRSYQSDILANTPSPVIAKTTLLAESQTTFISPKT